ncbi:hypothetical protein B0H14DRAFT_3457825 [Mycena olivaceomarginata]|nr:hypothetical protein B0H14DRAFT_3457825 [Mycena olivaceomarginata]
MARRPPPAARRPPPGPHPAHPTTPKTGSRPLGHARAARFPARPLPGAPVPTRHRRSKIPLERRHTYAPHAPSGLAAARPCVRRALLLPPTPCPATRPKYGLPAHARSKIPLLGGPGPPLAPPVPAAVRPCVRRALARPLAPGGLDPPLAPPVPAAARLCARFPACSPSRHLTQSQEAVPKMRSQPTNIVVQKARAFMCACVGVELIDTRAEDVEDGKSGPKVHVAGGAAVRDGRDGWARVGGRGGIGGAPGMDVRVGVRGHGHEARLGGGEREVWDVGAGWVRVSGGGAGRTQCMGLTVIHIKHLNLGTPQTNNLPVSIVIRAPSEDEIIICHLVAEQVLELLMFLGPLAFCRVHPPTRRRTPSSASSPGPSFPPSSIRAYATAPSAR